jgi:site-specific DNA-methyltransferase (adenine-specific)
MESESKRNPPGSVRNAIVSVLSSRGRQMPVKEIEEGVRQLIGPAPGSSVRSYLRLNTPGFFVSEERGCYGLRNFDGNGSAQREFRPLIELEAPFSTGRCELHNADCFDWLEQRDDHSIHAVVTDPPYGLHEYSPEQQAKLREGRGGVWRIPPSFDGHVRSPLPRFTTLTEGQLDELRSFFLQWTRLLLPKLVPGANVLVASNPLLSHIVSGAMAEAGLERRGEIIRLVMTMRGGDRPKDAHEEFPEVSVMPRSMWEPWLVFRKVPEGRIQDNLRKWKTGGFRRPSLARPFGDVIESAPTRSQERALANHPSLKPQAFMRQLVKAVLPLGEGVILDPFAGGGSTLAAAEAVGYASIGVEKDAEYFVLAQKSIPRLAKLQVEASSR